DKLSSGSPLDQLERQKVALFIALLRTRVPEFHELVQEFHGKMVRKRMELLAKRPGALESMVQQMAKEKAGIDETEVSAEQLGEFIERGEYKISVDRLASLQGMVNLSFGFANVLTASNWAVLKCPDGTSFVTSDNPVVPRYPPLPVGAFHGVGFASPEVTKFV